VTFVCEFLFFGDSGAHEIQRQVVLDIDELEKVFGFEKPKHGHTIQPLVSDEVPRPLSIPSVESEMLSSITLAARQSKAAIGLGKYMEYHLPPVPKNFPFKSSELSALVSKELRTPLLAHQFQTIMWARHLETRIACSHKFVVGANDLLIGQQSQRSRIIYDPFVSHRCRTDPFENYLLDARSAPRRYLEYRGGIIADDSGLGKTLTILGLIATTKSEGLASRNESNGTLIVCPVNAVEHWGRQIQQHCKTLKSINLKTKADCLRHLKHIRTVDVVVISARLFCGSSKLKDIHSVMWKRIVFDEGNRIVEAAADIYSYNARSRWYVTADPLPRLELLYHVAAFLQIRLFRNDRLLVSEFAWKRHVEHSSQLANLLDCVMHTQLFSRHSRFFIEDKLKIPEAIETCEYVELHPIEQILQCVIQEEKSKSNARKMCLRVHDVPLFRRICLQYGERGETGFNCILRSLIRHDQAREQLYLRKLSYETEPREKSVIRTLLRKINRRLRILTDSEVPARIAAWEQKNTQKPGVTYLSNLVGTKFAHVCVYIAKKWQEHRNRIIICHYRLKSHFIEAALRRRGIRVENFNSTCKKALKAFREMSSGDYPRVISLSPGQIHDVDPYDVIKTTHVCLVDPVTDAEGTAYHEEMKTLRHAFRQCIANDKPCRIVRFICKNSIDERFYKGSIESIEKDRQRRKEEHHAKKQQIPWMHQGCD